MYLLLSPPLSYTFTPNINYSESDPQQCNTPSSGTSQARYTTMSNALAASGRDIYYAMCNWGQDSVWTWGGKTANSWRVSSDVTNKWSSIVSIASGAQAYASYAGPGGFNDFDMLEVGNGGLTTAEERAHFGIWAIAKSPLLIGTDLSKINKASLAVLLNKVDPPSLLSS
jgi:alpha-galactosidase